MSASHPGTPRLDAAHWDSRYTANDTPWDHGEPAPGLMDFLSAVKPQPGRILVPGCGVGHDCRALAAAGFKVTGLDVSPQALARARQLAGPAIDFRQGDFLTLPAPFHEAFDWLFEHTCFCAIDPAHRDAYVRASAQALHAGGQLLGIFFDIPTEKGPPFGATREELRDRFGRAFDLVREWTPRSWPNRQGEEVMMLWTRRVN